MLKPVDEKGMAAIVAFSVLFILLTLGAIFLFSMDTEFKIATNQKESTQALYIAESGLERGMVYLKTNSPPWSLGPEYLGAGSYTVSSEEELDDQGDPTGFILITSTGEVESATQKGVKATRKVRLKVASKAFKYALLADDGNPTGDDIGQSTVTGLIDGDIHANGSINQAVKDIVKPGNNITEGDADDPKVTWPTIDMSYYEDNADTVYNEAHVFDEKNYNDTMFYVKGQALIDLSANDVEFKNCVLVAEGAWTTTTYLVNPGDPTVPVVSTDRFPSEGKASINGDEFNYTAKDSANFTGVTGIDNTHDPGASVTADEAIVIGQLVVESDILLVEGSLSFPGGKKEVLFQVENTGSTTITIDSLSATWTKADSVMKQVDMPDGTEQWSDNNGVGSGVVVDFEYSNVVLSPSGEPGDIETVRLYFSKKMDKDTITVTFYDVNNVPYPVSLTPAKKKLRFKAMEGHPALATKEGDIFESGSTAKKDRDIKGVIYSEQGEVKFQYLTLDGEIIASQINLARKVDIMYKPQWVPDSLPGVIGGMSVLDWQEIY